eukprot:1185768-Prorocentrum_minimum.AAC.2
MANPAGTARTRRRAISKTTGSTGTTTWSAETGKATRTLTGRPPSARTTASCTSARQEAALRCTRTYCAPSPGRSTCAGASDGYCGLPRRQQRFSTGAE